MRVEVYNGNYFAVDCRVPKEHKFVEDAVVPDRSGLQPLFISLYFSVKYFTVDHGSEVCTLSVTHEEKL